MELLVTFLAGMSMAVGALFVKLFRDPHRLSHASSALALGAILALALFDLGPEAVEFAGEAGAASALLLVGAGFGLLALLELFVPDHDDAAAHEHHVSEDAIDAHIGLLSVVALVLHNLSDERKALEKRLDALGRQNESVRECELELTDAGREPVRVRWSYYLNDAGWQPRYRVQAVTDAGQVLITMDAVMRQGGGADWKGVDVTLASSKDFRRVTPPPLPDWILGDSLASSVPRAMNVLAARAPAMGADAVAAKAAAPRDSGLRWSLGKTDIPAGAQTARPVDERRFAATFFRLIRPTEDERAWFVASLEEEAIPLLPLGQASFLVDGAETARGAFRLAPGERDVSFGVDPLIGVKKNDLPTQGAENEAGIKTRQWRWKTDIVNGHDKAVTARVEAPAPILRDARMRAKVKSKPAADFQEERALYEWRLEVPALKTASVVHEVTVTSPIDASSTSH